MYVGLQIYNNIDGTIQVLKGFPNKIEKVRLLIGNDGKGMKKLSPNMNK
jgi:hypothetical protein